MPEHIAVVVEGKPCRGARPARSNHLMPQARKPVLEDAPASKLKRIRGPEDNMVRLMASIAGGQRGFGTRKSCGATIGKTASPFPSR